MIFFAICIFVLLYITKDGVRKGEIHPINYPIMWIIVIGFILHAIIQAFIGVYCNY